MQHTEVAKKATTIIYSPGWLLCEIAGPDASSAEDADNTEVVCSSSTDPIVPYPDGPELHGGVPVAMDL